jgi:hypothetical protein
VKQAPNPGLQFCANLPFENAVLVVDVTKLSGHYAEAAPVFTAMMQGHYKRGRSPELLYLTAWIHTAITEIYHVAEMFLADELAGNTIDLVKFSEDFNNHYISPYLHDATLKRWVIDAGYELYKLYPWHTLHTSIIVYQGGLLYVYVSTVDPYAVPQEV